VKGDCKIQIWVKHSRLCHFWLNTGFIPADGKLTLAKDTIDVANKDDKTFKPSFAITAYFKPSDGDDEASGEAEKKKVDSEEEAKDKPEEEPKEKKSKSSSESKEEKAPDADNKKARQLRSAPSFYDDSESSDAKEEVLTSSSTGSEAA
jgi:hypothetical protein